jgi:hypothetical protein
MEKREREGVEAETGNGEGGSFWPKPAKLDEKQLSGRERVLKNRRT